MSPGFYHLFSDGRDSNPGIPDHFLNPESQDWQCFNPGISGLRKTNIMPEFYVIVSRKIHFSRILGVIPGSKAENERIDPNTKYVIKVDIVLRAQSC